MGKRAKIHTAAGKNYTYSTEGNAHFFHSKLVDKFKIINNVFLNLLEEQLEVMFIL